VITNYVCCIIVTFIISIVYVHFVSSAEVILHFWQIVDCWYIVCYKCVMQKSLNHSAIMKVLDWAYEKAISGVPGMDSAAELAQKYMKQDGTIHDNANSLIRWQNAKAGTSGFLTGMGGFASLPVAIPANLASVLFIQIRMIAAIAQMGGHNLRDDKVRTLVYVCLVGNFAKDILQESAILIGTKLSLQAVRNISERSLLLINQRVGFRLLSTYGSKGVINLTKVVPVVGGVIGGTIDTVATNIIGNIARKTFLPAAS